ncbi:PadR family transcriptional regulator [Pseudonocardia parietis]|uniref:DNA-binding PadR family transcriptional regulator n=1 Tax=Pseudonocardia parietis TaxID=570936 RepID=A0ABS4VM66_9PSEU|nr:PadR family transcriptional regulator [Pseudonocardia parietis]MBP2364871.1 DNA-binding PadR family transcriptional regulator [Pseudonocardia parietis]
MLEFAVLGLLQEAPLHGYELRKQLGRRLGGFRAFSYGSLYPALRRLVRAGLIAETGDHDLAGAAWSRRGRRVYRITAEGKERFAEILDEAGPQAWEDGSFGVHLAFFSRTPAETRIRILEGRRRTVEERRDGLRSVLNRTGEQIDRYTRELHRLGLESSEREVRWLNELIAAENAERSGGQDQTITGDDAGTDEGPGHRARQDETTGGA